MKQNQHQVKSTTEIGFLRKIHECIHSSNNILARDNMWFQKFKNSKGCRYIDYNDIRFVEQDKNSGSQYAMMAKGGEKITWGIRSKKHVYYIHTKRDKTTVINLEENVR